MDRTLSIRKFQTSDIPLIIDYWYNSDPAHLHQMGADQTLLPDKKEFTEMLSSQLQLPLEERKVCCMIWQLNNKPIGHCNTNPTRFGEAAFMHLHLWKSNTRRKGMGAELLKLTLPHFFESLKLRTLLSEPYALNPAPNRTLEKVGFQLVKEYVTVPGGICFEQSVKQWRMSKAMFDRMMIGKT